MSNHQRDFEQLWQNLASKLCCFVLNHRILWHHDTVKKPSTTWFSIDTDAIKDVVDAVDKELKIQSTQKGQQRITLDIWTSVEKGDKISNILLERWTVEVISPKNRLQQRRGYGMIHELPVSQAYRKITVMMRSIYTLLLSMPLYRPYREHFAKHKDTLRYQIYGTPTGDPPSLTTFPFDAIDVEGFATIQVNVQYKRDALNYLQPRQQVGLTDLLNEDYLKKSMVAPPTEYIHETKPFELQSPKHESKLAQDIDEEFDETPYVELGRFGGLPAFGFSSMESEILVDDNFSVEPVKSYQLDFLPLPEQVDEYVPTLTENDNLSRIGLFSQANSIPSILIHNNAKRVVLSGSDKMEETCQVWDIVPHPFSDEWPSMNSTKDTPRNELVFADQSYSTDPVHLYCRLLEMPMQLSKNYTTTLPLLLEKLDTLKEINM